MPPGDGRLALLILCTAHRSLAESATVWYRGADRLFRVRVVYALYHSSLVVKYTQGPVRNFRYRSQPCVWRA